VNNKVVSKDTEQDLVLVPASYWQLFLQPKLEKLLRKKLSHNMCVRSDDTKVVVSVADRSGRDLTRPSRSPISGKPPLSRLVRSRDHSLSFLSPTSSDALLTTGSARWAFRRSPPHPSAKWSCLSRASQVPWLPCLRGWMTLEKRAAPRQGANQLNQRRIRTREAARPTAVRAGTTLISS
jgi:hypothetical protein